MQLSIAVCYTDVYTLYILHGSKFHILWTDYATDLHRPKVLPAAWKVLCQEGHLEKKIEFLRKKSQYFWFCWVVIFGFMNLQM